MEARDCDSAPGKQLDVRGVCCPLPLIMLAKAMEPLKPGQELEVVGNDPIFETSVRDFCAAHGHTLLNVRPMERNALAIHIRAGA